MWRSIDVRAVVRSMEAGEQVVHAGAEGLDRTVRRATLVTTLAELHRAGAEELVVCTPEVLAEAADDGAATMAALAGAGVAGIAVATGAAGAWPTARVLEAAEHHRLPVLVPLEGTGPAEVTAEVLDALLVAQRARLEHLFDVDHRFTRIVLAGGGTTEIATTLHELLGCPVAVLDGEGRPLVRVPDDAAGDEDHGGVRQPVRAGDDVYGEIVVHTGPATLGDDATVALERAAVAVAVRLAQAAAVAAAHERFAAISLEELVAGHTSDPVEIAERAASFGWDLARPRAVLLASVDPPDDGHVPEAALTTIAAAARASLGRHAIVWARSAAVAALLAPETDEPTERRHIAEGLRRELDRRLRAVTVSIGVGRRVDTVAELRRSYVEAARAVDVGRWAKGRHITEVFDELGLERLLAASSAVELGEFVDHAIGPLLDHDRRHRAELVPTLETWLVTRNVAETARRMHLHYNTARNRLDRIERILGPVLDDAARALECEIAIYVDRHYDVTGGPSARSTGGTRRS